ncbi:MAG: D-alanyl-D-alanine carboxypeptidase [Nitrospirota bacterium]|nr:D-alanyl-D-alanine carboxypeptidase [Nitrospirota bacterium]
MTATQNWAARNRLEGENRPKPFPGVAGWLIVVLIVSWCLPLMTWAKETTIRSAPNRPRVKASAVYLMDMKSGQVLLQKNATQRLPPASLTKIMTALVALEKATPQQIVSIDRRALVKRPPRLKLQADEEFLLNDLLAAMLVTSANDACQAVAFHIGGEMPSFVDMMNNRAKALDLSGTHFANPCGFDDPDHYSTAADLAKLTEEAMQTPTFAMMVRTLERDITSLNGQHLVHLSSTNQLLLDPDVTGVKTGFTSKAGRCLIASMYKNGHHLLLVGLNVKNRWKQAEQLFQYGQTLLGAGIR